METNDHLWRFHMETMGLEGGVDVVARGMSRDLAPQVRENLKISAICSWPCGAWQLPLGAAPSAFHLRL